MLAVILAGGSGTRFWPLSRESHPKQFLKIADSKTLIQRTVERLLPLVPIEKCFVATNELHALKTPCSWDQGSTLLNLGKSTMP